MTTAAPPLQPYAIGDLAPPRVVRPLAPEEVAAALKAADDAGEKVVPWGAGTKQRWGNAPTGYHLALDVTALDQLVEYEPADLVVTAQAGMRLATLQEHLAKSGQFLPLDPPYLDLATLGGTLATNASGPSRFLYGTARDFVLGLRVATPQGQLVKSGGRVVKNVVGYDLNKLHVGGLGTAGVIVECTFKVQPIPAADTELTANFPTAATACAGAARLVRSHLYLRAVDIWHFPLDADGGRDSWWFVKAWCSGSPAAVDRQARDSSAWLLAEGANFAARHDRKNRQASPAPWLVGHSPDTPTASVRLTCLPSQLPTLLGWIPENCSVSARAGNGVVHIHLPKPTVEEIRRLSAAAHELGGSAVLEEAPPDIKSQLDSWDPAGLAAVSRTDYDLMRSIKAQFDPKSTLNPGRFVAGI